MGGDGGDGGDGCGGGSGGGNGSGGHGGGEGGEGDRVEGHPPLAPVPLAQGLAQEYDFRTTFVPNLPRGLCKLFTLHTCHSSPLRLVQIPDCPRHWYHTNFSLVLSKLIEN